MTSGGCGQDGGGAAGAVSSGTRRRLGPAGAWRGRSL